MRWILIVLLVFPFSAWADGLPVTLSKRAKANPVKLLSDVTELIAAYGTDGGIDRHGMDDMVALARASARATALRRLQGADLDGDGAIAGPEIAVARAAASARARGRLAVNFADADRDGDKIVTADELAAYAGAAALDAYDAAKVAQLHDLLVLDGNGDGKVTVPEVAAALSRAAGSTARQAREIQNEFQIKGHDDNGNQDRKADQPTRGRQIPHLSAI